MPRVQLPPSHARLASWDCWPRHAGGLDGVSRGRSPKYSQDKAYGCWCYSQCATRPRRSAGSQPGRSSAPAQPGLQLLHDPLPPWPQLEPLTSDRCSWISLSPSSTPERLELQQRLLPQARCAPSHLLLLAGWLSSWAKTPGSQLRLPPLSLRASAVASSSAWPLQHLLNCPLPHLSGGALCLALLPALTLSLTGHCHRRCRDSADCLTMQLSRCPHWLPLQDSWRLRLQAASSACSLGGSSTDRSPSAKQ
mmetsp:Transcript_154219/g.273552  ORF Transcript_154219/g.273552 Transcript_154219/m.273552 type:complete len:251 (+) Transcript_154219:87-839(+)